MQVLWDQVVTYYLLYSLGGLAILLTLMHMLYKRRSPISMIAWLLFMVIAPYLFVLFYFLFGIRKRTFSEDKSPLFIQTPDKERPVIHPIDTLLRGYAIAPATNDNTLMLYTDAVDAYNEFFAVIRSAEHSIFISTYLLRNDHLTKALFDILIEKSKAGVDVRILTDSLGSMGIYLWRFPLKRLRDAGIRFSFFMPLFSSIFRNRLNLRYHRKIYLIDQKVLFSGGMNLAKEYMSPTRGEEQWIDILYRCEGSMVSNYIDIFDADWKYAEQNASKKIPAVKTSKKGDCELQVIPSGPDVTGDALLETIIYAINRATERIWIVTPYFVPGELILRSLQIARNRGLDVKLITPKESNHLIADLVRSSYIRELQEWNIDIALYEGPMLHAKAVLFDNDAVLLGSVNLDNRSLLLNYEVVTIAYSKEQIDQMDAWMKKLLQNASQQIEPAGSIRRVFENLMRIFALQL